MKRRLFSALLLSFVVGACDKNGVYPFGTPTDVVEACTACAEVGVYLRSKSSGGTELTTEMLIVENVDPTAPVAATDMKRFLFGTVERNSTTLLYYGTYELAGNGSGVAHITATYTFNYEANIPIAGREGAQRQDDPYDLPIRITGSRANPSLEIFGQDRTLTPMYEALDRIDLNDAQGPTDLYQVYNLALFFSQVRIQAFGGLGMTRYVTAPGRFDGLVAGYYTVSVKEFLDPTATITYNGNQDFPGVTVDGPQITKVDTSGNGPMEGVLTFEIKDPRDVNRVMFSGSVDYQDIGVRDGVGALGEYIFHATDANGVVVDTRLPVSLASNVDLTNMVPVTP